MPSTMQSQCHNLRDQPRLQRPWLVALIRTSTNRPHPPPTSHGSCMPPFVAAVSRNTFPLAGCGLRIAISATQCSAGMPECRNASKPPFRHCHHAVTMPQSTRPAASIAPLAGRLRPRIPSYIPVPAYQFGGRYCSVHLARDTIAPFVNF